MANCTKCGSELDLFSFCLNCDVRGKPDARKRSVKPIKRAVASKEGSGRALSCYGRFSPQKGDCKACEFSGYCKDSTKMLYDMNKVEAQKAYIDYEKVTETESYSEPHPSDDVAESSSPAKLLSELLWALHDEPDKLQDIIQLLHRISLMYTNSPLGFKVALAKVLNPEMSYSEIGGRFDTSKQLVAYHLNRAKELVPTLESAILVDNRNQPKLNYSKNLTRAVNECSDCRLDSELMKYIRKNYASVIDFSNKMGISISTARRAALGIGRLKLETRRNFAKAFGLTLEQLRDKFDI